METRTCCSCKEVKSVTEFSVKPAGRKTGLCRPCKKTYNQTWYLANKAKHVGNVLANNKRYKEEIRQIINEAKSAPCSDCGETFHPEAMDFDHRDSSNKVGNIAHMAARCISKEKILSEMAKCDVVCACCHRVRTANRRLRPKEGVLLS